MVIILRYEAITKTLENIISSNSLSYEIYKDLDKETSNLIKEADMRFNFYPNKYCVLNSMIISIIRNNVKIRVKKNFRSHHDYINIDKFITFFNFLVQNKITLSSNFLKPFCLFLLSLQFLFLIYYYLFHCSSPLRF